MARRANPAVIGAFVVGAVAIVVVGLLSLGQGPILERTVRVVAIFRASVAGLDVGAPVRFRGVPIGRVTSIHAQWSEDAESVLIPVQLELEADGIRAPEDGDEPRSLDSRRFLAHMVALGLRAKLEYDSYLTNKLYVAFDFHPDTPVELVGGPELFEMPTVPAALERLKRSLEELPLEELVERALGVVTALEALLADPRVGLLLDELRGAVAATEAFARGSEHELATLSGAAVEALATTRGVLVETGAEIAAAAAELGASADDLGDDLAPLSREATALLGELRGVVARLEGALALDPNVGAGVSTLVAELTATARSIRRLTEFLERNPESLLRGRRNP